MGNFAENLNLGNRVRPPLPGFSLHVLFQSTDQYNSFVMRVRELCGRLPVARSESSLLVTLILER